MRRFFSLLVLVSVVLTFGCQKSEESVKSKAASQPVPTPAPVESEKPLTIKALTEQGVLFATNSDQSIKAVDFSQYALNETTSFAEDAQKAMETVRVIRGKGLLPKSLTQIMTQMPKLTELLWTETELKPEWLAPLAKHANLKKIRFSPLKSDSPGQIIATLASLPSLIELDLSGSKLNDSDWSCITAESFPKLIKLNIYQTPLSDSGLNTLLPLASRLESLNLDATQVTDSAASTLEKFTKLTFLHLGRTTMTDKMAPSIVKLTSLKKVHLTRTQMTENGFDTVKKGLPACEVITTVQSDSK